ncbi:uncharacterized protein LOC130894631 [Diorhabda carinulata]|uniref:uncharacterized protein LOC130894631 n=1 Tax=Diorhabda carinulata TaxID=1163345 RepID=UPI0025A30718|nr:uncharacterized protein LOC130894631 [Diorhabda carinulata]
MSYASSILLFLVITFMKNTDSTSQMTEKPSRLVRLNGCNCNGLECQCCFNTEISNSPDHKVCARFSLIPNEVTLRATITVDGTNILTRQLDPSIARICSPPIVGMCLAVNHINLQQRQVCTKLYAIFLTLVKFPCVGIENGKLVVKANNYT